MEVLGRRADGFHELRSLVAFAGVGDTVELTPGDALDLHIDGPFAGALDGENLILAAAEAAKAQVSDLTLGRFRLVKTLPVAAGLGGGSADAAAALRLLARVNAGASLDANAIAPALGSDVAVCLTSLPALITSRGEIVTPVSGFPACGVLLVNPGVGLSTADVYGALKAAPVGEVVEETPPDFSGDLDTLIDYASTRPNDLEPVAARLAPEIGDVLGALRKLDGVRLVRLSGSGATCFAVFDTPRAALRAATVLAQSEPDWWIAASPLGDPKAEI